MNLQGLFRSLAFQPGLSDFVQQLIKGIIPGVTSSAGALQKIQNLFSLGPLAGAARLLRGLDALGGLSAFLRWGGLLPRLRRRLKHGANHKGHSLLTAFTNSPTSNLGFSRL